MEIKDLAKEYTAPILKDNHNKTYGFMLHDIENGYIKGAKRMYWNARKAFCGVCGNKCQIDDIEGGGGTVVNCDKLETFCRLIKGE